MENFVPYFKKYWVVSSNIKAIYEKIIIHLLKGEMSVFIEEKEYHLVPGDLAFVFPEQLHAIDSPISS